MAAHELWLIMHASKLRKLTSPTRLLGAVALWLAVATVVSGAENLIVPGEQVGMSSDRLKRVVTAMQKLVDKEEISGAVVMVARYGKVVLWEAVGKQDLESGVPMSRDTIVRIYSMTKPVTSVAALMLYEEGKLSLDDPVSKYIPVFKRLAVYDDRADGRSSVKPSREMTIRDLMRHTSGLTYGLYGDTPVDQQYKQANVLDAEHNLQAMIDKLAGLPLMCPPGSQWNYSVSTDVLGYIAEQVSGIPLDQFFAQRIFDPLEMSDTGFFVPPEKLHRLATNYGPDGEGGLKAIDSPPTSRFRRKRSLLSGGGGLVSTAADYMRFCQMLLNDGQYQGARLLKPETIRMMTTNQVDPDLLPLRIGARPLPGLGYGLGVSVVVQKTPWAPFVPLHEFGWAGAATTHFWISPQHQLATVALTQYMPFSLRLEGRIKPLVYSAITN
jgi:CubicO group peptidase (beta-lactamase class C family)